MNPKKRSVSSLALVLILSSVFFVFFLLVSGIMFLYKSPTHSESSSTASSSFFSSGQLVGVVEIQGEIKDSRKTVNQLDRAEEDDRIKAVVLRLNSPGGAVAPSQEIYEAVKAFKKPLVVSMGSVAASGAFYIACGAKKVFANPGTLTGSIGVIMQFANLEKLYDWAKVHRYSVKTGKFKDIGAEYRAMTEEERSLLEKMENDILEQFKEAVASGRKLSMDQVSSVADGRILSGKQAKEARLIDELGTFHDAVRSAAKLGRIEGKPVVLNLSRQKKGLKELLFEDSSGPDSSMEQPLNWIRWIEKLVLLTQFENGPLPEVVHQSPGVYWIWNGAR